MAIVLPNPNTNPVSSGNSLIVLVLYQFWSKPITPELFDELFFLHVSIIGALARFVARLYINFFTSGGFLYK